MVVKWIQSILNQPNQAATNQGADVEAQKKRLKTDKSDESQRIDRRAVEKDSGEFDMLVRSGFHTVQRERLKTKIRKKVWDRLDSAFSNDEVIEEVTERIVNAAETDPHYFKMFNDKE